ADHIHLSALKEYDALTDAPVCCLYQGLDKAYPGSKFILTVREKQAWMKSCQRRWRRHLRTEEPDSLLLHYRQFVRGKVYGGQRLNSEILSAAYDRYVAEVLAYFKERPDDLLILDICGGDGWSKLAPFLGVPIPSVAFPWENRAPNQ